MYSAHGDSKSKGVSILLNPKLEGSISKCVTDTEGRIVCIQGTVVDKKVVICNIYALNTDDCEFFKKVISTLEEFEDRDIVILGGDFNLVMNAELD